MSGNIYFECRKQAAINNDRLRSRAGAAEYLGISESSLTHYELGLTKSVPVDVVVTMAELYNAPQLKYSYCRNECPIGRALPFATEETSVERATVHLLGSLDVDLLDAYGKTLLRIAADGTISREEARELEPILEALDRITAAASELKILVERCEGGTHGAD